jgi:hypothetical protein
MDSDILVIKQKNNLLKQNEGIEKSLTEKGVEFSRFEFTETHDLESELNLIKKHNEYLKELSKQHRPKEQPKPKEQAKPKEQPKPKEQQKSNGDDDEENEYVEPPKPVYSLIANMEDIKRSFFSKDYDIAFELIKQHPFKFYKANYKHSSDFDGRPDFVARNLLRGFVQSLEEYRKYLMVCFRCIIIDPELKQYNYLSYWIVNTNDDLKTVLGDIYDDFDFILLEADESKENLLNIMKKNENDDDDDLLLNGEVYLH